ncbi:S1 family peptidase [Mycolicibacterium goodii]|uniref:S1 family peptidase n=1 Tax=Mycolicibacterium goodii TaxID=134601 RepID=UPI001BDCA059|nr:S1 family peptidase [Mycolicibacterium goodii]MBU8820480.1 S1 family peptidase [Mycolicibacterium goodii]
MCAADTPGLRLQPGVSIYVINQDTQIQSTCTLGWLVVSPAGELQALTAGHCRTGPQIDVRDPATGASYEAASWVASRNSGRDSVLHGVDIATVAISKRLGHSVSTRDGVSPVGVSTAQDLLDDPPVQICKRGGQTGVSCGALVAVSDDRVAFRAAVDHGDSGGPVWAVSDSGAVTAVAVVVGQSDDDPSVTVGQLINPWLLRFGAKLGVEA